MKAAIKAWLDTPIPRKRALGAVLFSQYTNVVMIATWRLERNATKQNIHILRESVDFLMEKADPATVAELNDMLDFWRAVKGIPTTRE